MSRLRYSAEKIDQAEELVQSGDYRRAIALFTEAIALCTQAISPHPRLLAVAYKRRALAPHRLGKGKESARDLETARRFEKLARHHVWIRNQREHPLTKTISLALCDPAALARLKETGECDVAVPEAPFDEDSPGHYMRRLNSVG